MNKKEKREPINGKKLEVLKINKLKEAQLADERERDNLIKGMKSVFCGEEITLRGVIGHINTPDDPKYKQVRRFNLYYASMYDYTKVKIIFRKMLCQCNNITFNEFYNSFEKADCPGGDRMNISNEVIIHGQFSSNNEVIFNIDKIELYDHTKELPPMYTGNFMYSIFCVLIKIIDEFKDSEDNKINSKIEIIAYNYKLYIEFFNDCVLNNRYADLKEQQSLLLNDMYNNIEILCNDICRESGSIKYNGTKIRKIIEDIAMMHTSIQSEDFDQLGVLYDNNCLRVMYEATTLVNILLLIDNECIDNEELIIILLVFFRGFYAKYLQNVNIPIKVLPAYRKYSDTVSRMLRDMDFDLQKESKFFTDMKVFLYYILSIS